MGASACTAADLPCEALTEVEFEKGHRTPRKAGVPDLRGVLEIQGVGTVGAVTRLAIAEALAATVRRTKSVKDKKPQDLSSQIRVEVTREASRPETPLDALRFAYCLRMGDQLAAAEAQAILEKEAASGGVKRLLPRFAVALEARGEAIAEIGEVTILEWTIEPAPAGLGKGLAGAQEDGPSVADILSTACSADPVASACMASVMAPPVEECPAHNDTHVVELKAVVEPIAELKELRVYGVEGEGM
eukprot:gnl/TRDRNA2_/TRDRNA2_200564_c0_seq1.p1 gnl/TRDRNA2_/TRDRNA2_200564_c0~~gnl/TRDRNA2_/TRDRNA2_200564_c0_seq1.p1  ORF type:complete len:269 (+),score=54.52 gnl/TRDRNA2_/TRDRNA2_200564_c0_seq1:70-807(+)